MRSLKIINRTHDALFEISWGKCLSKPLNYLNSEIIRARKITIARNKAHSALYMKLTLTLENILATTIAWLLRSAGMCWPSPGPPWTWCSGTSMVQVVYILASLAHCRIALRWSKAGTTRGPFVQLVWFVLIFDASLLQCSAHLILKHLMSSNGAREQDQDYSGDEQPNLASLIRKA